MEIARTHSSPAILTASGTLPVTIESMRDKLALQASIIERLHIKNPHHFLTAIYQGLDSVASDIDRFKRQLGNASNSAAELDCAFIKLNESLHDLVDALGNASVTARFCDGNGSNPGTRKDATLGCLLQYGNKDLLRSIRRSLRNCTQKVMHLHQAAEECEVPTRSPLVCSQNDLSSAIEMMFGDDPSDDCNKHSGFIPRGRKDSAILYG